MIDAWADAHAAAARARVDVRAPATVTTLEDARAVYDATWTEADGTSQITSNLLRAVVHAGGLASVAYRDEVPVGAALAFVGRHQDSAGAWNVHLHSHMAAVLDGYRDQHIGAALKLHQRAWALDHGIDTIVWTFDPLVRRNVRLNLLKLGADVDGFEVDFYGSMDDGINTDDPTDRLFAWWRLDSDRVAAALAGGLPPEIGWRYLQRKHLLFGIDPAALCGNAYVKQVAQVAGFSLQLHLAADKVRVA